MSAHEMDRRAFLHLLGAGSLAALAACSKAAPPVAGSSTPSTTPPASPTPSPQAARASWQRIRASGPSARRDYVLVPEPGTGRIFLHGGRAGGVPLDDTWVLDVAGGRWERVASGGPPARFGHNAGFLDGGLVIFAGQGGPGQFFNDVWSMDPVTGSWEIVDARGGPPGARYGAGSAVIDTKIVMSHGFAAGGRFADTWTLRGASPGSPPRWSDDTPEGTVPVKRCLHRLAYLPDRGQVLLFGGQTDGTPFLGDSWLYDDDPSSWARVRGDGPSPRNLYAMTATGSDAFLVGGFSAAGARGDVWRFDGARRRWTKVPVGRGGPGPRGGIEATLAGGRDEVILTTFGGSDGSREFDDTWTLRIPRELFA